VGLQNTERTSEKSKNIAKSSKITNRTLKHNENSVEVLGPHARASHRGLVVAAPLPSRLNVVDDS
jgi:hypothetical protein